MKKYIHLLIIGLFVFNAGAQNNRKLLRSESFWGLHFDKHSSVNDTHIGASLTEEMVDSMLRIARPDYIQVDSKGHPGVSSYPTNVGQRAAGYDKDPLLLIRKVTQKHNVALYVHHSGVMDINYVQLHPEQARFTSEGVSDGQNTSLWGNYATSLLIPQLKELASAYQLDGVWIDGESWAVQPDYQPLALSEFKKETTINSVPKSPAEPGYKELLEFNRKKFVSYIKQYTDEVHREFPHFQICSNWAYSALMPEPIPVTMKLDFLSGDYDPDDALNTANWNSRCLAAQGKPFDLMAWSFVRSSVPKTALQLCQEAASVISMGGGCQVYFRQNEDLSFQPASFHIMKEMADFMLPRREFCKDIVPVPQIGLFYSTAGWKNEVNDVYRPLCVEGIRGTMNALLDGQHAVEVLMTHHLAERMHEYPVIVLPEWNSIEEDMIIRLKDYVKKGGNLLIIGANTTRWFDDILGVKQLGDTKQVSQSLGYNGCFVDVQSQYREVACLSQTKEVARLYKTNDFRYPAGITATVSDYGKGKVAGVYSDIGSLYPGTTSPVFRDFLSDMVNDLYPEPLVRVSGSHRVNVVPVKKDKRFFIQLVNTSGDHGNPKVKGIDEIPVLYNLELSVRTKTKPKSVLVWPEGDRLDCYYEKGQTRFVIPEIKIHSIIEIIE